MADDKISYSADFGDVLKRLDELGKALDTALAKGPRGAKAAEIALQAYEGELKKAGQIALATGANIDSYNQKLAAGRAIQAASVAQIDAASKSLRAQKTGLDDLGRAAGLPVGELGKLALAGTVAAGAIQDLKKGTNELIDSLPATAEQAGVLKESVNALLDPSHFLLHTFNAIVGTFKEADSAIEQQAQHWADLLEEVDKAPAVYSRASEAATKVLASVRGVIKAREDHKAAIKAEVDALEATIRSEERLNGVSEESRQEAEALIKKYGDELPESFGTTYAAIGKSTEALEAERDAANKLAHEGFEDLLKKGPELEAMFSTSTDALEEQTGKILEGVGSLKLMGTVTKEESDKVVTSVLAQLDAYRAVGKEAPQALIDLAGEWVDLEKQTKKGGESTRKEVEGMLDAYGEAGKQVPKWLQDIATKVGAVDAEQRKAAESAKKFLDAATETAKQMLESIEGTTAGIKERTVALIASTRAAEQDGRLSTKATENLKNEVQDLIDQYETAGFAIPEALQQIVDRYGILSKAAEESAKKQADALAKMRGELQKNQDELAAMGDIFDTEGLVRYNELQDQIWEKQKQINDTTGLFGGSFADAFGDPGKPEDLPLARFESDLDDVGTLADKVMPKLVDHAENVNAKLTTTVELLTAIHEKMVSLGE